MHVREPAPETVELTEAPTKEPQDSHTISERQDEYDLDPEQGETKINSERPNLTHTRSHVSTHDVPNIRYYETGDEIYDRFPRHRKTIIMVILCSCSFLAPFSSTAVLAATPEVADTYNTTGTIINVSNALYQLFMGISPLFWGPLGHTFGRRWTQFAAGLLYTVFSIGTALSPNLAAFFIFRILTAFQGTAFLIIGSSCIGDIYRPVERATAISWFFSGTLIGRCSACRSTYSID